MMRKKLSPLASQLSFRRGFTLIELLVVISIISVLAAFLMANFVGVRARGRDSQRKSELRQIQNALELYRSDNGNYPLSGAITGIACGGTFSSSGIEYMKKFPCDPLGDTYNYNGGNYYYESADGVTYTLAACLENSSDKDSNNTSVSPGGGACSTNWYFVLNNP